MSRTIVAYTLLVSFSDGFLPRAIQRRVSGRTESIASSANGGGGGLNSTATAPGLAGADQLNDISNFLKKEVEWGQGVRSNFVAKRKETVKKTVDKTSSFWQQELAWGAEFRTRFAAKELDRREKVLERAVSDELRAREAASGFLDNELSKVFAELQVCADFPACGKAGGLELFEAVTAFQFALKLGVTDLSVRRGKCQSVCPRDGGVVVTCPDQRTSVCAAPPFAALADPTADPASEAEARGADEPGAEEPPELDGKLLALVGGEGAEAWAEARGEARAREGQNLGTLGGAGGAAGKDWSEVASQLLLREAGARVPEHVIRAFRAKQYADHALDLAAKTPPPPSSSSPGAEDESKAGAAARSSVGGSSRLLEAAHGLYGAALEGCPPWLLEPRVGSEEEAFATQRLQGWAGSVWFETAKRSVLTLPEADYFDSFFTEGRYGSRGGGLEKGVLSNLIVDRRGLLTGDWREVPTGQGAQDQGGPTGEPTGGPTGQGAQGGRFRLKLSRSGHAFLGERLDVNGKSLELWHGHRLLPSGPPASAPPLGLSWVHGALLGRARCGLELFLEAHDPRQRQRSLGSGSSGAAKEEQSGPASASDLARVAEDCESALAVWPWACEPLMVLAAAREQQRDLQGAIEAYERLLFLQPPVPANVLTLEDLEELNARDPTAAAAAVAALDSMRGGGTAARVGFHEARLARLWDLAAKRDEARAADGAADPAEGKAVSKAAGKAGWELEWDRQVEIHRYSWRW